MNHPNIQIIFRILIVLLVTVIGLFLLFHFIRLTYPFLIAGLFAFFIQPIVKLFEKYLRFPRPLAILMGILFLIGVIGSILTVLVKLTVDGIIYLSEYIPNQIEVISGNVQSYFNEVVLPLWIQGIGFLDTLDTSQQQVMQEGFQIVGSNLAAVLGTIGQSVANGVTSFIGALPITFTVIIFSMLAVYFISKESKHYKKVYQEKLPAIFRRKTWNVIIDLKTKIFGFFRSQVILMVLTALVSFIGLLILRVDQAFTIAVILGLIDLLPYLGPGLIIIPWSIYSFITGDIFLGVGLLILYASTVVARQVAEPKVLSSSMKLNPLAILVSLFAGLQLFGLVGLIIGPISLVLIMSLYDAKVFEGLWEFIKGEPNPRI
ncbi:sporulation integral membrane protein YtvI [Oceanobacillus sp. CAU 1775]